VHEQEPDMTKDSTQPALVIENNENEPDLNLEGEAECIIEEPKGIPADEMIQSNKISSPVEAKNSKIDQPTEIKKEPTPRVAKHGKIKSPIEKESAYKSRFYPINNDKSLDKSLENENLGVMSPQNINAKAEDFKETLQNFEVKGDYDDIKIDKSRDNSESVTRKKKRKKRRNVLYERKDAVEDKPLERSIEIQKQNIAAVGIPETFSPIRVEEESNKDILPDNIWGDINSAPVVIDDPKEEYSPGIKKK